MISRYPSQNELRMILFPIITLRQKSFIIKPNQNNPLKYRNLKSRFKEVFSIRLNTADYSMLTLLVFLDIVLILLYREFCQVIDNATCHHNIMTASVKYAPEP